MVLRCAHVHFSDHFCVCLHHRSSLWECHRCVSQETLSEWRYLCCCQQYARWVHLPVSSGKCCVLKQNHLPQLWSPMATVTWASLGHCWLKLFSLVLEIVSSDRLYTCPSVCLLESKGAIRKWLLRMRLRAALCLHPWERCRISTEPDHFPVFPLGLFWGKMWVQQPQYLRASKMQEGWAVHPDIFWSAMLLPKAGCGRGMPDQLRLCQCPLPEWWELPPSFSASLLLLSVPWSHPRQPVWTADTSQPRASGVFGFPVCRKSERWLLWWGL